MDEEKTCRTAGPSPCIAGHPPDDCRNTCGPVRPILLEKGRVLVGEGDEVRAIYKVEHGLLRAFRVTSGGSEAVLMLLGPGDLVLNAPLFRTDGWVYSVEAVAETRVRAFPTRGVERCSSEHREVAAALTRGQSDYVVRLFAQVEQMKVMTATQRFATYLLALAEASEDKSRVRLPYEKRLIAQVLGITPESLSRSIARLRDEGVAVEADRVAIGSLDRLADFAQQTGQA